MGPLPPAQPNKPGFTGPPPQGPYAQFRQFPPSPKKSYAWLWILGGGCGCVTLAVITFVVLALIGYAAMERADSTMKREADKFLTDVQNHDFAAAEKRLSPSAAGKWSQERLSSTFDGYEKSMGALRSWTFTNSGEAAVDTDNRFVTYDLIFERGHARADLFYDSKSLEGQSSPVLMADLTTASPSSSGSPASSTSTENALPSGWIKFVTPDASMSAAMPGDPGKETSASNSHTWTYDSGAFAYAISRSDVPSAGSSGPEMLKTYSDAFAKAVSGTITERREIVSTSGNKGEETKMSMQNGGKDFTVILHVYAKGDQIFAAIASFEGTSKPADADSFFRSFSF